MNLVIRDSALLLINAPPTYITKKATPAGAAFLVTQVEGLELNLRPNREITTEDAISARDRVIVIRTVGHVVDRRQAIKDVEHVAIDGEMLVDLHATDEIEGDVALDPTRLVAI